jgi:hypothetical protein
MLAQDDTEPLEGQKESEQMENQFEVLSPWAEVDATPLKAISPRLADLAGKKIGLYANSKIAALPMLAVVEEQLKERFQGLQFSRFERIPNVSVAETDVWPQYQEWIKGVDAVILSHGD